MYNDPNRDLKQYNTFGLKSECMGLIHIYHEDEVLEVLEKGLQPIKILGGGSNILLTGYVPAYILKNEIKGIEIIEEDEKQALVCAGAGEKWENFVTWAMSHQLAGLENLSLIPGSVGAAPMQNIGAYGIEQDSAFYSLKAIHLSTGQRKTFVKDECKFGYRESVFKNELKDQYFITHVLYLLKKSDYTLNADYGAIREILNEKRIIDPKMTDISDAVITIRKSKLPDPKEIGNAGSFFKNPVISFVQYCELKNVYTEMPSYKVSDTEVKVPAGWLIEKCGFKGKRYGNIGVHKNQALVLVHYGDGNGDEILQLAKEIQATVLNTFSIEITPEVNIW